jgi:hypothetical protein
MTKRPRRRRHVRVQGDAQAGHKTLGTWCMTFFKAYGKPIDHYGDIDTGLSKFIPNQKGPIESFLS